MGGYEIHTQSGGVEWFLTIYRWLVQSMCHVAQVEIYGYSVIVFLLAFRYAAACIIARGRLASKYRSFVVDNVICVFLRLFIMCLQCGSYHSTHSDLRCFFVFVVVPERRFNLVL